ARRDAEERARRDAEEKARCDAEEKARRDAEEKARRDAEEQARRDAEELARRDAARRGRKAPLVEVSWAPPDNTLDGRVGGTAPDAKIGQSYADSGVSAAAHASDDRVSGVNWEPLSPMTEPAFVSLNSDSVNSSASRAGHGGNSVHSITSTAR